MADSRLPGLEGIEGFLRQLNGLYGAGAPTPGNPATALHSIAADMRGDPGLVHAGYVDARNTHAANANTHIDKDDSVRGAVATSGTDTVAGRAVLSRQLTTFQDQLKALAPIADTRFGAGALLDAAHLGVARATGQVQADAEAARRQAAHIVPPPVPVAAARPRPTRVASRSRIARRARGGRRAAMRSDGTMGGNAAVAASKWLGAPYVWGGGGAGGPSRGGFDCSGLTQYAVAQASRGHVMLPRTTYDQIHSGVPVSVNDVRPGDLVFPRSSFSSHGPEHVQLAAGRGMVLEAPHAGANVQMTPMSRNSIVIRVL